MKIKKVMAGVAITIAAAAAYPAQAHALPDADIQAIGQDSWQATCGVFDEQFTGVLTHDIAVATGVLQAVSETYAIAFIDAADVVNWQVYYFCDEHWDNLVAVGEAARTDERLQYS